MRAIAARWRMQAEALDGREISVPTDVDARPIVDTVTAIELGTIADVLTRQGASERARDLAGRVAVWARVAWRRACSRSAS